jgi:hypothetical protein
MAEDNHQFNIFLWVFVVSSKAWTCCLGYASLGSYHSWHLFEKFVCVLPVVNSQVLSVKAAYSFSFVLFSVYYSTERLNFHDLVNQNRLVLGCGVVRLVHQSMGTVVVGAGQTKLVSVKIHLFQKVAKCSICKLRV